MTGTEQVESEVKVPSEQDLNRLMKWARTHPSKLTTINFFLWQRSLQVATTKLRKTWKILTGSLQEGDPEYDYGLDENLGLIVYEYIQLDPILPNNMMQIVSTVKASFLGSKIFGDVRDRHFRDVETNIWSVHARLEWMQYRGKATELEAEFRAAISELQGLDDTPSLREERGPSSPYLVPPGGAAAVRLCEAVLPRPGLGYRRVELRRRRSS